MQPNLLWSHLLNPEASGAATSHLIDGLSTLATQEMFPLEEIMSGRSTVTALGWPGFASPGELRLLRAAPGQEQRSVTSGSVLAGLTGDSSAPVLLSRDLQPWNQDRVNALVAAGTLQTSWLPDIRAVVPEKLQIQREQQRDMLRFSNSIANTGANNWQVRRGTPLSEEVNPELMAYARSLGLDTSELAVTAQELLNDDGSIGAVITDAALSEYHPEHKHFHIGETAAFSLERLNQQGGWDPITGLEVVKTTFCLIDVNQIQAAGGSDPDEYEIIKSPANANVYNDCFADVQGIQDGWIDRYSHSLPGQEVDVSSLAAGTYRLLVTVNPSNWFLESDYSNNLASVAFELHRNKQGQATLTELSEWSSGIWFDQSPNGMG